MIVYSMITYSGSALLDINFESLNWPLIGLTTPYNKAEIGRFTTRGDIRFVYALDVYDQINPKQIDLEQDKF